MKRFFALVLLVAGLFVSHVAVPHVVQAQVSSPELGLDYATAIGLATTDVRVTISRIINVFLGLLGIVMIGIILYGGFLYMTDGGTGEGVTKAKKLIANAAIGLVIVLSAYAITAFIFRAIIGEQPGGTQGPGGVCPPGQVCGSGIGGGTASVFKVDGITPVGVGPTQGWPRNSSFVIRFTSEVNADPSSINSSSIVVKRCNERLSGGAPTDFQVAECDEVVNGTRTVSGKLVTFTPTAEDGAALFESDFWYQVTVLGSAVKDTQGRSLFCPFSSGTQGDPSSTQARRDLCTRAAAIGAVIDSQKPTVQVNVPQSPPSYCAARIPVQATGGDDFGVAFIDYRVDGGSAALVDGSGLAVSVDVNATGTTPSFDSSGLFIETSKLTPGSHTITATPTDMVGNVGAPVQKTFSVTPASCCNGVQDADKKETGVDCGAQSACGACAGASCTGNAECQSGACVTNRCEEQPIIDNVGPVAAGPGSFVTVSGRFFGGAPGRVVFLGADTDGNGDPKGDADDVDAQACAAQAWSATQVVVAVPANAVSGPVELRTSLGKSDRTDRAPGFNGVFTVNDVVLPGICFLEPSAGLAGATFAVRGNGFGATQDDSRVFMDTEPLTIAQNGWTASSVSAVVPALPEGLRSVRLRVGGPENGVMSNSVAFSVRASAAEAKPRITSISPGSGPVGATITITGTGFGRAVGHVRMALPSGEVADLLPPAVCSEFWHENYIVVKIPERYQNGVAMKSSAAGVAHAITVETSQNKTTDPVTFNVNTAPVAPSVCSIIEDNGPAGKMVEIRGEGFGNGPAAPSSTPKFSVEFFGGQGKTVAATAYSTWSPTRIVVLVPGDVSVRTTWPQSGPVTVVANNTPSANTVPFSVQDCRDQGVSCASGLQCCGNGSCSANCEVGARSSAYGWQFSTAVLPTLPVVVERQQCDPDLGVVQSPSPFKGSSDACLNAGLVVEFSKLMDQGTESFNAQTVLLEECGSAEQPACSSTGAVPLDGSFSFTDGAGSVVRFLPTAGYNNGTLKQNTWYRITLVSQPASGVGIKDVAGRFLDGDRDGAQGGSYQWSFKTRDNAQACALSDVGVNPGQKTIDHQGGLSTDPDTAHFGAILTAANCNALRCAGNEYTISWASDDAAQAGVLNLLLPKKEFCPGDTQPVTANKETEPGKTVQLVATVVPAGQTLAKKGSSDITVKFADPVVTDFAPRCDLACTNASIYAMFNIPMDVSTLTKSNVEFFLCRDALCNPPYDPAQQHAYTVSPIMEGGVAKGVAVNIAPDVAGAMLKAKSKYIVRLRGAKTGIKSASGALLTGLNDGDLFTWTFTTKDSTAPCAVSRAEIAPKTATLSYVGERASLRVVPFGSPDACDNRGQQLVATAYNWQWTRDAGFISGFVTGALSQTLVDTKPVLPAGCNDKCLLAGSQVAPAQCGNGKREASEDCDDGNSTSGDGCSIQCLAQGTVKGTGAGQCGNEQIENGETCEAIKGEFPPGCKNPDVNVVGRADLDGRGCVSLGSSSTPGSVCGNKVVTDGETCDDGNTKNGDGCSSQCLREGALPSCADVDPLTSACVSSCGNGRIEVGEDPECDVAGGPAAHGCSPVTCLKVGTNACANVNDGNCCGNGLTEAGEDALCDVSKGNVAEFCTARCTLKGSSFNYRNPSFCGDGIRGDGESIKCDGSMVIPDLKIDPVQVVQAGQSSTENGKSTITASVNEITDASKKGTAVLSLSCTCTQQSNPQQFCADIGASQNVNLGCSVSGCCALAPRVVTVLPRDASQEQCRNTVVKVVFDQTMDLQSIRAGMFVGEEVAGSSCGGFCSNNNAVACTPGAAGDAACGAGGTCVQRPALPKLTLLDGVEVKPQGFFARAWGSVVGWVKHLFGADAGAANPPSLKDVTFCAVPGTFAVTGKEVSFTPAKSFAASKWHRVFVDKAIVKAGNTVPLGSSFNSVFRTAADVCKIGSVTIAPNEHLFTTAENLGEDKDAADEIDGDHIFTSKAHPANRPPEEEIVSTPEYRFKWNWSLPVVTSPITLERSFLPLTQNGFCEVGEAASAPDCSVNIASLPDPKPKPGCGNGICEAGSETATSCPSDCASPISQQPSALVAVRTEGDAFPRNGNDVVRVTADISEQGGAVKTHMSATADVAVMLCENPWPARRTCTKEGLVEPAMAWDPKATCDRPGESIWFPFYDPATNVEFYYCRDGQAAGAEGDTLPALKENVVRIAPGRDILFEYLFTFETPGPWSKDAIGLRVAKNLTHQSVGEWYAGQGFRGQPRSTIIDGSEALLEGRTIYINAPTLTSDDGLFTNINVFSFNDGATPETVSIFNRVLDNISMSRNLKDFGFCVSKEGDQIEVNGIPVACRADRDCTLNAQSEPDANLAGNTCLALKSKVIRDAQRLSSLAALRRQILASSTGFPTLQSGTYLRAQSVSAWPSWTETLAPAVGAGIPTDPLNAFTACPAGFDEATCFNATQNIYRCPAGSHVYEYQSVGGSNFRLRNDFEGLCHTIGSKGACEAQITSLSDGSTAPYCRWDGSACTSLAQWRGSTCVEVTNSEACSKTPGCAWNGTSCNFTIGEITIGGFINNPLICQDRSVGQGGICGDGVLQGAEECEPGQPPAVVSCEDSAKRRGTALQGCTSQCKRGPVGACQVGRCGDGKQDNDEVCDSGSQNGNYGFCNATCTGLAAYCGDNVRQTNEACDCGDRNGQYSTNGVLQSGGASCVDEGANAASCSWDCSVAGPRCGDGFVNGDEECDGGFQEARGYCSVSRAGCSVTSDCGAGGGQCVTCPTPEQRMRRACGGNDVADADDDKIACKYADWACTSAGFCGNGTKETGEACDDGNTTNTDACVIDPSTNYLCRAASCGDGYVQSGVEQCDAGGNNGQACIPGYGLDCQYCTTQCKTITVSGGYCGDGVVQTPGSTPSGTEECEANIAAGQSPYICVSSKPDDQDFGVISTTSCDDASCRQSCGIDFNLCFNDPSTPDSDTNAQNQPAPDGIRDSCDPDKDNDAVPATNDCNDLNRNVFGAYAFGNITAHPEVCTDQLDNDCDGLVNNVTTIAGNAIDMKTNAGISNAQVKVFCANVEIGGVNTSANGSFSLTVRNPGTCGGTMQVTVTKTTTPAYCFTSTMTKSVNINQCGQSNTGTFVLAPKPPNGAYDMYVRWTPQNRQTGGGQTDVNLFVVSENNLNNNRISPIPATRVGNLRHGRFTPLTTENNKLAYMFIQETLNNNLRSSAPSMEVWRSDCTVSTVNSTAATPSTSNGPFWHGFDLNTPSNGNRTVINKFLSQTPATPPPPPSPEDGGNPKPDPLQEVQP